MPNWKSSRQCPGPRTSRPPCGPSAPWCGLWQQHRLSKRRRKGRERWPPSNRGDTSKRRRRNTCDAVRPSLVLGLRLVRLGATGPNGGRSDPPRGSDRSSRVSSAEPEFAGLPPRRPLVPDKLAPRALHCRPLTAFCIQPESRDAPSIVESNENLRVRRRREDKMKKRRTRLRPTFVLLYAFTAPRPRR